MKKVLALVLAVMMMATVAFADPVIGDPAVDGDVTTNGVNPGGKITIKASAFLNGRTNLKDALDRNGDFSSENFSVTTKRFDKGSSLVKSVEFDDDDNVVVIKMNDNFDLWRKDTINLAIKELKISAKKKLNDDITKGSKWVYNTDLLDTDFRVGYVQVELNIEDDMTVYVDSGEGVTAEGGVSARAANADGTGKLVKFVKDEVAYGTATIDFGGVASATGRVYDKDVVFLDYNEDVNVDVVKKYPDADLTFVNFKGAPTFNSNFELEIYADEDTYIYELKDNKIAPCSLKWDDDAYAFTGKVRTLGAYVISDTKLSVDATAADGNPDTGANDVVGIATALAAVALVSAAAVSLKK
ncbi:MAG: hypothetical protein HFF14_11165 [Angelakisella sp.]|nr:hypothetical protein [Angelakisella sp.]